MEAFSSDLCDTGNLLTAAHAVVHLKDLLIVDLHVSFQLPCLRWMLYDLPQSSLRNCVTYMLTGL